MDVGQNNTVNTFFHNKISLKNEMSNDTLTTTEKFYNVHRPRGSLARALHDKVVQDQYLSRLDKKLWYQCDLTKLPFEIRRIFVQLSPDEDTIKFLEEAEKKSDWIFTQIWHMLMKMVLGWFMTQTSINGWLQRGSMFVISQVQLMKLLNTQEKITYTSLLDLGAGDGKVTAQMTPLFQKIYVTEMSSAMRSLLHRQGYQVLDTDTWYKENHFDVISCLNLLDRCDAPLDLLQQIRGSVKPDGIVLLAMVLPYSAYVETGSSDHKPQQLLPIVGDTFEEQVQSLVKEVLIPAKFEVVSWSKVPYLCEGDLQQSYYWLDDVFFVLRLSKN